MGAAFEKVTAALVKWGSERRGPNWNCPGPLHAQGDTHPSLTVGQGERGVVLNCKLGCDTRDIAEAIGLSMQELFDEALESISREVARYSYVNNDGEVLFAKIRYDPKSFSIVHPNGSGWEKGLGDARRVLYNLPDVKRAIILEETIYIVEGEKDADRLCREGVTATTNFDGANRGKTKWRPEYTDMLAGAKNVIVVADRDEAGYAHARAIKESLTGRVGSVKIVQSAADWPGADVSDHLDALFTIDQLLPVDNEVSRQYKCVDWQRSWNEVQDEANWLKEPFLERGTVNALFGQPGVGKSLLALEVAVEVVSEGGTVLYVDDENRIADTVERLRSFGCKPAELERLRMYSFAGLPPLDTGEGGRHLAALADAIEPDLCVLDTTTRMVQGKENDADTFLQLYRCSLVPLKGRGITVLRLDHPGKDDARGQRGSSAKSGAEDTVWALSRDTDVSFTLECQKSRSGHVQFGHIVFLNRIFSPLRHVWNMYPSIPADRTEALVRTMERLEIPVKYGRDRVREVLRDHHVTARNEDLSAAIAHRKELARRLAAEVVPEDETRDNLW
jgi:5S rRNA maturation endonuclease (ribonuclease M5)